MFHIQENSRARKRSCFLGMRGFTLVEVMLVLAVTSVLLGLMMSLVSKVHQKSLGLEMVQEVITIVNVQYELSESNTFGMTDWGQYGATSETLAKTHLLPNKYLNVTKDGLQDPMGGAVTIDNMAPYHFIVWLWRVPYTSCVTIATQTWDDLYQFGIGTVNLFPGGTNSAPVTMAWSANDAEKACATPGGPSTWMAIGFWAR